MKVIRKDQTKKVANSKTCRAFVYSLEDKDVSGAIIKLDGRYPDKGKVINLVCKELAYVVKGKGIVCVSGKKVKIKTGDLILINPKEKFFWQGKLTMFISCTPPFNTKQHKETE